VSDSVISGLVIAGLFLAFVVGIVSCAHGADWVSCRSLGREASVPVKYSMLSGCYVQIDGHWFPASRWRAVEDLEAS
jgi:hypothetical protein